MVLERLPLTPNGKVDRKALPAPELRRADRRPSYVRPPRTPTEEVLAGIWAEVLGSAAVGGGRRLLRPRRPLAARHAGRLARARGASASSCRCARSSSGRPSRRWPRMAERLRAERPRPALPPLRRRGARRRLPLSFAQQRLWFLDQLDRRAPPTTSPRLAASDGRARPRGARAAPATRSCDATKSLRTTFADATAAGAGDRRAAGRVRCRVVDLRGLPASAARGGGQRRRARREPPFDLSAGPLFARALLRLDPSEHVAAVTMHHIVPDGWSMGVLVRELAALYASFAQGRSVAARRAPIQYADYAVWQREWLQGEALERAALLLAGAAGGRAARCSSCRPTGRAPPCRRYRGGARRTRALARAAEREPRGAGAHARARRSS